MIGLLPTELTVGNRTVPIDSDFRTMLNIYAAFNDPELTAEEQCFICVNNLFEDFSAIPHEHIQEAVEKAYRFAGGGDIPENALEAIALALKSDWTTDGSKRRHVILVFSDAPALPLGARAGSSGYPSGMPADIAQLGAWWEATDQTLGSNYQAKAGRLVAFVPNAEPWTELQAWNRYWPAFSPAGTGLPDVDIQSAIDLVVGSF